MQLCGPCGAIATLMSPGRTRLLSTLLSTLSMKPPSLQRKKSAETALRRPQLLQLMQGNCETDSQSAPAVGSRSWIATTRIRVRIALKARLTVSTGRASTARSASRPAVGSCTSQRRECSSTNSQPQRLFVRRLGLPRYALRSCAVDTWEDCRVHSQGEDEAQRSSCLHKSLYGQSLLPGRPR